MAGTACIGRTAALLFACAVGACAANPPSPIPAVGTDVACLNRLTGSGQGFQTAMAGCGTVRPDLTGSSKLQHLALAEHVPFTIRPTADAILKSQAGVQITGSLLPASSPGANPVFAVPRAGQVEPTIYVAPMIL